MRILLATPSVLLGVADVQAKNSFQHHEHLFLRPIVRLLEISEECLDDTLSLHESSTSLEGAYEAMEQEVSESEDLLSCESSSCTVDFSKLESAPDYKSECEAAGGTVIERSATMSCTSFSFEYNNVMECTAPSCNEESIDEELTKSLQETEETVETRTGSTCSSEMSSASSETSSGLSGGAIFGIVVAVLAVIGAIAYGGYRWYKKEQEKKANQGPVEEQAKNRSTVAEELSSSENSSTNNGTKQKQSLTTQPVAASDVELAA